MLALMALMALATPYAGSSAAATRAASSAAAVPPPLAALGRAILPRVPVAKRVRAGATSRANVPAAAGAAPTVTLTAASSDRCDLCADSQEIVVADGTVTASATATAGSGASIANVAFYYRPYDAGGNTAPPGGSWHQIGSPDNAAPYSAQFIPSAFGLADGDYQVEAVATESGGSTGTSNAVAVVVLAFGDTYLDLAPIGSFVRGTVALRAEPAVFQPPGNPFSQPDTVSFQTSPSGAGTWTTVATVSIPDRCSSRAMRPNTMEARPRGPNQPM